MADFRYRDASDFALHVRHFHRHNGVEMINGDAMAIATGLPAAEIARRIQARTGAVFTAEDHDRMVARTDIVRVKLGRNPSVYDVLREFGDEATEAGLLSTGRNG
ncbi:hypothetical protein [Amycolatopsis japonica]